MPVVTLDLGTEAVAEAVAQRTDCREATFGLNPNSGVLSEGAIIVASAGTDIDAGNRLRLRCQRQRQNGRGQQGLDRKSVV